MKTKEQTKESRQPNPDERKEFWKQAALSVAAASNCTDKFAPARWADKMLEDFDERFGSQL